MELCEFQKIDPTNGLVYPWLTHPALEVISKWNLDGMSVLEYGGGFSTLWWGDKCKEVVTIETNEEWLRIIDSELMGCHGHYGNIKLYHRQCNEGDQSKIDYYTEIPDGFIPDIVVVDGILRYECILKALTLPRPLVLIIDNWQQDYVFICPAAEDALRDYEGQLYVQPDHKNHEGRPWTTAIFYLK